MQPYILCLVTIDDIEKANEIAKILVTEQLAACVNIVHPIRSIYFWKEQLYDESEGLLLIKTTAHTYPTLEDRVKQLHPYEVPEIIALPIDNGLPVYFRWIDDCLSKK